MRTSRKRTASLKKKNKAPLLGKGDRLAAKQEPGYDGYGYVFADDVDERHGKRWATKFWKAFGPGNTCPVIGTGSRMAIYHHDYLRFADVVDYKMVTYFD